jgi:broad specificity phosphatase PhoE
VRLLLIRHGQTHHNVTGAIDTAPPGADLTALGERQAQAVPGALEGERIDGIYASPLIRTRRTAQPLAEARGLEVVTDAGLREIEAADLEMRSDADSRHAYVACVAAWMAGDLGVRMPGGADGHAFLERYRGAVAAIAARHAPDDRVAVFSHGAAIRAFTVISVGMPAEEAAELRIMNTAMSVLEGDPGSGWRLVAWHPEPLGGVDLESEGAVDPTGESVEDVEAETDAQTDA